MQLSCAGPGLLSAPGGDPDSVEKVKSSDLGLCNSPSFGSIVQPMSISSRIDTGRKTCEKVFKISINLVAEAEMF